MKVGVRVLFEIFDENLWIYLFEIISTRLTVKVPFLFKHVFPTPQRSPSHVVDFHGFGVCVSIKQVFNSAFSQVFRIACHVFSLILLCLYVKLKKYIRDISLSVRLYDEPDCEKDEEERDPAADSSERGERG